MPRVTIWREAVLPNSETFIVNQMHALRRWTPVLSAIRALPNALGITPDFALEGSRALAHRADRWLYWRLGTSPRLHRRLRDGALVHAHFGPDAARVARAAQIARRPLIVTFHGYDTHVPPADLGVDYRPLFRRAARLVAISHYIRGRLLDLGAPAEKIVVLPIGIPLGEDAPRPATGRRVVFVGRLVEVKGCADLLEAVAGLDPAPAVEIIGDGPLRGDLERRAGQLRIDVTFAGERSPAEVARAVRAARVVCIPSRATAEGTREGLSIVSLEAAAQRVPVVGYRSGGVTEAVRDGVTGLLADEGDVPGLAHNLSAVLADAELAGRLGAAGRRRVEQAFDITACTAHLEGLYDEVAAGA